MCCWEEYRKGCPLEPSIWQCYGEEYQIHAWGPNSLQVTSFRAIPKKWTMNLWMNKYHVRVRDICLTIKFWKGFKPNGNTCWSNKFCHISVCFPWLYSSVSKVSMFHSISQLLRMNLLLDIKLADDTSKQGVFSNSIFATPELKKCVLWIQIPSQYCSIIKCLLLMLNCFTFLQAKLLSELYAIELAKEVSRCSNGKARS